MNLSKLREIVTDREAWHAAAMGSQRVRHNLATKQQQQYMCVCVYTPGFLPSVFFSTEQFLIHVIMMMMMYIA